VAASCAAREPRIVILRDEVGLVSTIADFRSGATWRPIAFGRDRAALTLAPLRIRSRSSAFARSPSLSVSAFLHSIMPSPVRWRSSITMLAAISAMSMLRISLSLGTAETPQVPKLSFKKRGRGPFFGVSSRRRFGDLDEFLARLDDLLDHEAPAFEDRVRCAARVQADRPARIVVAGDHVRDAERRMIGVDDGNDRDAGFIASVTAILW
jgi:hypothetical protein